MSTSADPINNTLSGLITIESAAASLGVSHMTVRRMIQRGVLRQWRRLGRVLVSEPEVSKLVRERERAAAAKSKEDAR